MTTRLLLKLQAPRDDSERGATAVEYGLMVALIAAVIVGTVILLGQGLDLKFNEILGQIG
ncbi:pilus assembly protein [Planomonospora sphaerica]|uniref:Pilus assembly protein n=1 Tax=Planomonospora sphaerica TaxID=161355 RepID=A0A161LZ83_9ACTN|nr:Flp family type IVb pilin [Planomonospora sphaerica]GAT71339.1 pilus assembly protein [Planomonospora sphaerica]